MCKYADRHMAVVLHGYHYITNAIWLVMLMAISQSVIKRFKFKLYDVYRRRSRVSGRYNSWAATQGALYQYKGLIYQSEQEKRRPKKTQHTRPLLAISRPYVYSVWKTMHRESASLPVTA